MKEIVLSKGIVAFVDDEDFESLNKFKWHTRKKGKMFYAIRNTSRAGNKMAKTVWMHKELLKVPEDMDIEHKNRNGLDNQKNNLRQCTKAQNQWNTTENENNTSGFKGCYFDKRDGMWFSSIQINGVRKYLGRFKTVEESAKAYDDAAFESHGEFYRGRE